jgi:LysM repeat protein
VLLAVTALALSLVMGANNPVSAPSPAPTVPPLPPTQPGLSRDEGVFLFTTTDDGTQLIYFIARNTRHNVTVTDLQLELQQNPLWPIRQAPLDYVKWFAEGGPIGAGQPGLLNGGPVPAVRVQQTADATSVAQPAPAPAAHPPEVAPAPVPAADDAPVTYILRRGDDLTHVARAYGTTVEGILAANGLPNANRIYAGQSLVIPVGVAEESDVASAQVADVAPTDATTTYTVAPGDSAFKIARQFGIDEAALLEANDISNAKRVYVGQVLTIPATSS